MAEGTSPAWKEKAGAILSSSSMKLKDSAFKASTAASGAADATGTKVKTTWLTTRQEWSTKVQPKVNAGLTTAARVTAETGTKLKTGFIEVRDKAAASKVGQQISETTRKSVEKSKSILGRVDFRPKDEKEPNAVFGVPLEVLIQRQFESGGPTGGSVPRVVALCAHFLIANGLSTPYLFEEEGNTQAVKRLMELVESDSSSTFPLGTSALDVAQLLMVYFRSLPEPVLTYGEYEFVSCIGNSTVEKARELVSRLPAVNRATLETLTGLLLSVSEKSSFNKMDARSLATEFAPLLIWKHKASDALSASGPENSLSDTGSLSPQKETQVLETNAVPPVVADEDSLGQKPQGGQRAIVEFVLCLIERHTEVFE